MSAAAVLEDIEQSNLWDELSALGFRPGPGAGPSAQAAMRCAVGALIRGGYWLEIRVEAE